MELKDEDIKEALEEHIAMRTLADRKPKVKTDLLIAILDFINRQQAEIERLKWEKDHFEFKVDDLNGKLEKFKEYRDIKNGAYEREIERLQKYSTEVAFKHYNDGRAEAIKEFAERLKAKAFIHESAFESNEDRFIKLVAVKDIDKLLAEMVGGENA